jgi:hypothetical protein
MRGEGRETMRMALSNGVAEGEGDEEVGEETERPPSIKKSPFNTIHTPKNLKILAGKIEKEKFAAHLHFFRGLRLRLPVGGEA